jgi:hypothetical protein
MKPAMTLTRDHLLVDGRKVAVDVATLSPRGTRIGKETKPQLRFDRVVVRVNVRLATACRKIVPAGSTVVVTLTAPIRLAAKTAEAIESAIRALVARGSSGDAVTFAVNGNRVRVELITHGSKRMPRFIGFVHNPGTDPRLLLDMTREMVDLAAIATRRRASARGLVVMTARSSVCLDTYRYVYAQLLPTANLTKVLMVFGDGRAELLKDTE